MRISIIYFDYCYAIVHNSSIAAKKQRWQQVITPNALIFKNQISVMSANKVRDPSEPGRARTEKSKCVMRRANEPL